MVWVVVCSWSSSGLVVVVRVAIPAFRVRVVWLSVFR